MGTPDGKTRGFISLLVGAAMVITLGACGGGGGTGSTAPGVAVPAALSVSVASAPDFPAGTVFAPSTLSPDTLAPPNSPDFQNVYVWVTKLALIPSGGPHSPDGNGELEQVDSFEEDGHSGIPGFVTIVLPHPVRIDLLHSPTGRQVATLLNKVSEVPVPAGEYSKIRVYYDNVVGHSVNGDNTIFHPTAHYHFDVHFVQGNLVIPVAAPQVGTLPQEGIRFYSIVINIVGLKYHQAGNSGNVLLRPQVFAEFVPPVLYSVKGTADNVSKNIQADSVSGSFDVAIGGLSAVPVAFDNNTQWAYSDNVLYGSPWKILDVPNQRALDAFRAGAKVKVIGWFEGGTFRGTDILFTFPVVKDGTADNVWIQDNSAFIVRSLSDNVTVFPKPSRSEAYYDNLATPAPWDAAFPPLQFTALDNNLRVQARGYFDGPALSAYWISIGGVVGP